MAQTPRTRIHELLHATPPRPGVRAKGWARTVRDSKKVVFVELNDGSCLKSLQVVIDESVPDFEQLRKIGTGVALEVEGDLVPSPAAGQAAELKAARVTILGACDDTYPLQKKRHSFEYMRTIAHLRPRTNAFGAVFRVRSRLALAVHEFFGQRGFVYVHTPIITSADAEGAGELFRVTTIDPAAPPKDEHGAVAWSEDFFARPTFLTVSGQLAGETFALGLSDIYTFGPTFRAENSNTSRHAAEFWMIEPEMAFCDLDDDADLAEAFVKHCLRAVLSDCSEDLAFFDERIEKGLVARLEAVANAEFERLTYTDAVARLERSSKSFEYPVAWGANLQAEHERWLCEESIGRPTFVIDYPRQIKAFYMRRNDDGKTVAAMDLLVPRIGELIGGSQREERLDVLELAMRDFGLDPEHYGWYLDTRRFGSVPHAGFGLGFERLVMYVTGMENIRDVVPFPRTPRHCDF
jgi:asparaginyl-tRNA synthetase